MLQPSGRAGQEYALECSYNQGLICVASANKRRTSAEKVRVALQHKQQVATIRQANACHTIQQNLRYSRVRLTSLRGLSHMSLRAG